MSAAPPANRLPLRSIAVALLTPSLLGVAPIFGKLAIGEGADPFSVAAIRTLIAAGLLWAVYAVAFRRYLYIYPAGLLGCMVIGAVNGIGSLFYYGGLGLLDASLTQLLNGLYVVFALILSHLGGERITRRVAIRMGLAMFALLLLTAFGNHRIDWLGVGLMLGSALMFAGTVILSQYVVYEMPAPTMALYVLTTMAVLVVMVWATVGQPIPAPVLAASIGSIGVLGITTALSRLAMFASVRAFGSLRTAISAIAEIGVALALAFVVLGERLTPIQVGGVMLLAVSLLLIRAEDLLPRGINPGALLVSDMAGVQFQRIAFHRAFGTSEQDNAAGVMGSLTTFEMQAIQKMMGVSGKPVDPFPLSRNTNIDPDELAALLAPTRTRRPKGLGDQDAGTGGV